MCPDWELNWWPFALWYDTNPWSYTDQGYDFPFFNWSDFSKDYLFNFTKIINLFFHLFIHSLVDSYMYPGQGSNLQPWCIGDSALTNWATYPGFIYLKKKFLVLLNQLLFFKKTIVYAFIIINFFFGTCSLFSIFLRVFLKRFYLFIYRERGKEGNREGEEH